MDLNTLNFLKKPEEVKVLKNNIYIGKIIPTRVIKDRRIFEIIFLDESMFLEGFAVTTFLKEDEITSISLFGEHPNCDSDTTIYCWPESKKGMCLDQNSLSIILQNLQTYYLDNAYFIPGKNLLEYKELKSISIQLNEGE